MFKKMTQICKKTKKNGHCILAIKNLGHIGRLGAWSEMAAKKNCVSILFTNTSGFGILMAPYGGLDRRLSANPITIGIPSMQGISITRAKLAEFTSEYPNQFQLEISNGFIADLNMTMYFNNIFRFYNISTSFNSFIRKFAH